MYLGKKKNINFWPLFSILGLGVFLKAGTPNFWDGFFFFPKLGDFFSWENPKIFILAKGGGGSLFIGDGDLRFFFYNFFSKIYLNQNFKFSSKNTSREYKIFFFNYTFLIFLGQLENQWGVGYIVRQTNFFGEPQQKSTF